MLANFLYQELLFNEIDKPKQFFLNFANITNIIQYTFVGLLLLKLHKPIIIINNSVKFPKCIGAALNLWCTNFNLGMKYCEFYQMSL